MKERTMKMDLEKAYYYSCGNECEITKMAEREKEWASNRIQRGEDAIDDIESITRIANNVLYFNDSSDYETALWEILEILGVKAEDYSELSFIEDRDNSN